MHKDVKRLRTVLAGIEGAWVRRWKDRDGTIRFWAGAYGIDPNSGSTARGMMQVCAALDKAGIRHARDGKPGTSGAYIVDVYLD